MAEQVPFSIVEHILMKLGSKAFQKILSMYGLPKEPAKLKEKLDTVRAVLLDAEEKQLKSHAIQHWVQRLKLFMYDADDFLDDMATIICSEED
ncbi:hypothetical protein CK203_056458 [Vitis vinifera]|uniref:Disease resistance N-terminal domain-containing protein n=1 Tax=Vitis vinifera TaxID=29760 RepID=A0A438GTQ3_VITVI|nr:hypothetical protein CK203_056458 [Vitis vinifera]